MSALRHIRTQELWLADQQMAAPDGVSEWLRSLWSNVPQPPDAQKLEDAPENLKAYRIYTALRQGLLAVLQQADEEAGTRRFGSAVEILESALRLDGANLVVKNRLEAFEKMLPGSSLGKEPARQALPAELEAGKEYADELQAARMLFHRRQFQEAEQILIQSAAPSDPDVQVLLETVRQARAATQEEQFYKNGREKALELIQEQQFEQAADLLCNLLALFPGDPVLEKDLQYAQEHGQDHPEDAGLAPKNRGGPEPCEPQAEPACQKSPAQLVETKSPLAGGWAVIAAAGLFLLVAGRGGIAARASGHGGNFQESKLISDPLPVSPLFARKLASSSKIVSVGITPEEKLAWRVSQ